MATPTTYPLPSTSAYYYTQNPNYVAGQPSNASGNAQYNYYQNLNGVLTPLQSNPVGGDNAINNPTGITQINPNNLPSGLSFATPAGATPTPSTSGITSSASLGNYADQINALLDAFPGINAAQQSSIAATGAAAQQTIAAQGQAGDTQFSQAIQQAQEAENEALGNAAVSGAQANPTGQQNMQTFSPYSPQGQAQGIQANSTYTGMKASISNQFQQTIGNLQSQQEAYDAQVAAGQSTAAAQTQANALTAANSMITNQLSVMNNMMSVAMSSQSLNLQQEAQSQNFQLGMANYQLQLQSNQQQIATGQMNTILSSVAGTGGEGGWSALTPVQQTQLTTLANQAGMPASLVQAMVNKTQVTNLTTSQDAFGNTTLTGTDSSGKVITSQYVGGGISPGSSMANAIASSYGTQYNDIGANYFSTTSSKYSPYMVAAGYKYLSPTQATTFSGQYTAYTNMNQVINTLQSMSQLATSPGDLVSDYPNRTLQELLQVDPNQTSNPSQFSADLATLNSLNPSVYKAITSIQGLSGGIGLSALLNNSQSVLLNPNNTLQTNLGNMENIQGQLETAMQSTYGEGLTFPSQSASAGSGGGSAFSSFINGGGNSGSTQAISGTSPQNGQTYNYNGTTYVVQNGQWVPQQ